MLVRYLDGRCARASSKHLLPAESTRQLLRDTHLRLAFGAMVKNLNSDGLRLSLWADCRPVSFYTPIAVSWRKVSPTWGGSMKRSGKVRYR
jgi:hypothetical protein